MNDHYRLYRGHALNVRKNILEMVNTAGSGHVGDRCPSLKY